MDTNENGTPLSGGATVVTTDPSVTWSSFGNGQLKQTKNGTSQLGALLAGGQNSQNNSAPVSFLFTFISPFSICYIEYIK